jgi:hypothetical protein
MIPRCNALMQYTQIDKFANTELAAEGAKLSFPIALTKQNL